MHIIRQFIPHILKDNRVFIKTICNAINSFATTLNNIRERGETIAIPSDNSFETIRSTIR